MWGGARRAGLEVVSSHKGPSVNHFTYFAEAGSAERLVAALTAGTGTPAGFEPLRKPTRPIARAVADRGTAAPRPVVFVLPGIMGSELADANGPIWVGIAVPAARRSRAARHHDGGDHGHRAPQTLLLRTSSST